MKVKSLFSENEDITITSYLKKCGVEDVEEFLKGGAKGIENPALYNNMDKGFELFDKLKDNDTVHIIVDVDGDGYYSASIMHKYINSLDKKINVVPLFHEHKIHGLKDNKIIRQILIDEPQLVIAPDSSSGDLEEHNLLSDMNIPLLILDHHMTDKVSETAVVINNKLSPNVINKAGSGALVTWKFCKYCDNQYDTNFTPTLIDLVYFSLLSDSCDMNTLENRAFSYWGMANIKNKLLKVLCKENLKDKEINNHNISWYVQPKISDIIRSEDELVKKNLYFGLVNEDEADILGVMQNYKKINTQRKNYVKEYFENIDSTDDSNIIFKHVTDLYSYYTGLVASRFNSKYNKPCILYKEPNRKSIVIGSVRSPYPIKQQLIDSGLFEFCSGHDSALGCGFKKENISKIEEFVKNIELDTRTPVTKSFNAQKDIDKQLFQWVEQYKNIFGKGIPDPKFHIYNISINSDDIKIIGKNKTTLTFIYNNIKYIKFMCSHDWQKKILTKSGMLNISVLASFTLNEWNGTSYPQVMINSLEIE